MADIDRELAAAKEAGVTVEQVKAITAEAIRMQNEPFDNKGFWVVNVFGELMCSQCKMPAPGRNQHGVLGSERDRIMDTHRAWHNQLEVRLRKLEQGGSQ